MTIKSGGLRFFFTIIIALIIGISLFYLYTYLIKVKDITETALDLNSKINSVLVRHNLSDAQVIKQYQTHFRERGLEWIKYTKEIKLPQRKYSRISDDIRTAAGKLHFEEIEKTSRKANITISEGPAVLADLTFSFIPEKGLLAIVIDDLGYSRDIEAFTGLDIPLTYAIIPGLGYSRSLSKKVRDKGLPYILHMPMEPEDSSLIADENILLVSMDEDQIKNILDEALKSVPGARGINNHMGSKFTADGDAVEKLVRVLKEKGLFLVDSKTSGNTVLFSRALECGVPAAQNSFFIDNNKDYEYIHDRFKKLTRLAAGRRSTVAIGHVQNKNTARVLKEFIPRMKNAGITFVEVKDILK